jgi:hypothetical protein
MNSKCPTASSLSTCDEDSPDSDCCKTCGRKGMIEGIICSLELPERGSNYLPIWSASHPSSAESSTWTLRPRRPRERASKAYGAEVFLTMDFNHLTDENISFFIGVDWVGRGSFALVCCV